MADLLSGTGMVESRDLTWQKVSMIEENIGRTGFSNIRAKEWDARRLDEEMREQADIVLADLPCSGLGIIGRKPDIKYRATRESLEGSGKPPERNSVCGLEIRKTRRQAGI